MRGRRDLLQHFVVSAALVALAGPTVAESAGLAKEWQDQNGPRCALKFCVSCRATIGVVEDDISRGKCLVRYVVVLEC